MDTPYHFQKMEKTLEYSAEEFYFSNVGIINHTCTSAKLIESNDLDLKTLQILIFYLLTHLLKNIEEIKNL